MLLSKWYGKGIGKDLSEFVNMLESVGHSRPMDQVSENYF